MHIVVLLYAVSVQYARWCYVILREIKNIAGKKNLNGCVSCEVIKIVRYIINS